MKIRIEMEGATLDELRAAAGVALEAIGRAEKVDVVESGDQAAADPPRFLMSDIPGDRCIFHTEESLAASNKKYHENMERIRTWPIDEQSEMWDLIFEHFPFIWGNIWIGMKAASPVLMYETHGGVGAIAILEALEANAAMWEAIMISHDHEMRSGSPWHLAAFKLPPRLNLHVRRVRYHYDSVTTAKAAEAAGHDPEAEIEKAVEDVEKAIAENKGGG